MATRTSKVYSSTSTGTSTKYASEVIKIYTTNCCQLDNCINRDMYKILQSVIMKTYMAVKTRTWYT